MRLTTNIDLMIEGTLNQDFDYITGAETIDDAIDIYTKGLTTQDRQDLKKEVLAFLSNDDDIIKSEFKERYVNSFAPEDGKGLLLRVLEGIDKSEQV
ncbi:contact-dependent growth inhibition system immunity protein [Serratia rubidaea]|uniref:CdiI immunity protein domain-containing protein n=1 Tax=Serratia rubidaea TaxID=61652 RepID=A0ABS0MF35_SERRU|nr:contact-dependent growth inhibition system immunity protein [Serratia rubidaea]MBH1930725.1 hypothetical protein [Serratia rubidaea]MDC6116645.1 contact-dependent growth inhibition system immunity protein [Serratia rubidaea]